MKTYYNIPNSVEEIFTDIENARKLTDKVMNNSTIEREIENIIVESYRNGYNFVLGVAHECLTQEEYDRLKNALKFNNHNTYIILGGLFLCTGMILDEIKKQ